MKRPRACAWLLPLALAGLQAYPQTQVNLRTQSKDIDFAGASSTRPLKTGTSLPATCQPGELFFRTDAPAGSNLYGCTSLNVWSLEASGAGGGGSTVPDMTNQANKVLSNDGSLLLWRSITTGPTGALQVTHSAGDIALDIVTAVLPQKSAANTFTGLNTFNLGLQLTPMTPPSSPSAGRLAVDSSDSNKLKWYDGASWQAAGGGGGGGGGLGDPGSNGLVARTALNTTVARTITGTANRITVTNGDGGSGPPVIDVGPNVVDKTVANSFSAGAKQVFQASATTAGARIAAAAPPSSPVTGDLAVDSSAGNALKWYDGSSWQSAGGSGGGPSAGEWISVSGSTVNFNPLDFGTIFLRETFCGANTANMNVGQLQWQYVGTLEADPDNTRPCATKQTTAAVANDVIELVLNSNMPKRDFAQRTDWELKYAFALSSVTDVEFRFGLNNAGIGGYRDVLRVKFNSATDSVFKFQNCDQNWDCTTADSTVAPQANTPYTVRIFSDTPNTIKYSVNGETPASISANRSNAALKWDMDLTTKAAAAKSVRSFAWAMKIGGLTF